MNRNRIGAAVGAAAAAGLLALVISAAAGAAGKQAAKFKPGGTLNVAMTLGEPDALDPTLARTFSGREVFLTICEKLYDLDRKTNIVPQLAAALPTVSKNKLTVSVPLRHGIKFNDGSAFTSAAVVKTIRHYLTFKGSVRASEIAAVESVKAKGRYAVVFHLKSPYSPLTAQLADRAGMILSPTKIGANFARHPVCVGPYMYKNRIAGDSITVVKSPFYYAKSRVHFAKIVFKIYNDTTAAAQALKAGTVQAIDAIAPTDIAGIKADKSLRVSTAAGLGYGGITINIGNKNGLLKLPYQNVGTPLASSAKLRKAFELAINRNTLNKVVFNHTVLPGCTPISPSSSWFDKSIKCTPFNPNQAKQLVKSSGVSNPTVNLMVPTGTVALREAQFIQAEEAAVGIHVNVQSTDFVTALSKADAGTFDAFLIGWSGRVDPDGNIFGFVATTGTLNDAGYSNSKVDKLLNSARSAGSVSARRVDYKAVIEKILNDRPLIYLDHPIAYNGVSQRVSGVTMFPDTLLRVAFAGYTK
ncbi:MAG: ABC transporter substrate-binding protein [Gaiellaceae bacterium]